MINAGRAQELPAVHYTTEKEINPLPNPAVTGIYQDRLGYLWLCSYGMGLIRYDGHKMEIFNEADSLPSAKTWFTVEDSTGRLWAGTEAGLGVSAKPLGEYAKGERIRFLSRIGRTSLAAPDASFGRGMAVDTEGKIWFATRADGIIRHRWQDRERLSADTLSTAESKQTANRRVSSLAARKNGTIAAAMKGRVAIFNSAGQVLRILTTGDGLPDANISTLYESRAGTLFGASGNGTIWELVERQDSLGIKIIHRGLQHPVATLYETGDGTLWAATLGSGLVELNLRQSYQATIYGSKNGLLGEVFWDVSEDREGNLWPAQNTGLSKLPLNFRALQFYSAKSYPGQKPNLPASGVMSILRAETPSRETILYRAPQRDRQRDHRIAGFRHDLF